MPLLISKESPPRAALSVGKNGLAEQALACLQDGLYGEAYLLLQEAVAPAPQDPSLYFNLALCCLKAGEAPTAIHWLDAGMTALKTLPETRACPAAPMALERADALGVAYRAPMHPFMPRRFKRAVGVRFLRLLADACAEAEQWGRLERIAAALSSQPYRNLQKALAQSPHHKQEDS